MQSTAVLSVLPPLTAAQRAALPRDPSLQTLAGAFTAVPDPRSRHGRRYELSFLLLCLTAGLLANCNSLDAVGQWCRDQQELLALSWPFGVSVLTRAAGRGYTEGHEVF